MSKRPLPSVSAASSSAAAALKVDNQPQREDEREGQDQHRPLQLHRSLSRAGHHSKYNRRIRKVVRTVPWRDAWELQAVGKAMLSVLTTDRDDSDTGGGIASQLPRARAFEIVSIWTTRLNATEGLPHAVESTAALARVFWRDSQQRQQLRPGFPSSAAVPRGVGVSAFELRLSYASAIVRCINGFADTLQQQRFAAASVANLCGQMGIPTWIVDIRHEASHNALPTLEVLRLAASTLLEFLLAEYWIPTCPDWYGTSGQACTPGANHVNDATATGDSRQGGGTKPPSAVDLLLDYKACVSTWSSICNNGSSGGGIEAKNSAIKSTPSGKRKQKSSTGPPETTILSYDPLFGEYKECSSSDEDNGGGNDDDDDGYDDWEDPVLGSIWGSSVGTNTNRFAILQPPKTKKTKHKEVVKITSSKKRKLKAEKSPADFAKIFVRSVSLQEGYDVALRFLVWGGVGCVPSGRGVLIPGSEKASPASPKGVEKSWGRYSPLIHVICRTWPGFCPALLVHLVDFVLSIEDAVAVESSLDAGSARKLYFLSSWIRLLLSQRFVGALDQTFFVKGSTGQAKKRGGSSTDLALAQLEDLEVLGYPLNSILDRCCQHHGSTNSCDLFRKTSHDVRHILEEILAEKRVRNYGCPEMKAAATSITNDHGESNSLENDQAPASPQQRVNSSRSTVSISLVEMEALLSDNDRQEETNSPNGDSKVYKGVATNSVSPSIRPAWNLCQSWDPCSLGTMPGYPV